MERGYELIYSPRNVTFSACLDDMNPELAEMEALRRAAEPVGDDAPSVPHRLRRIAGIVAGIGLVALLVYGTRWGVA